MRIAANGIRTWSSSTKVTRWRIRYKTLNFISIDASLFGKLLAFPAGDGTIDVNIEYELENEIKNLKM
ncbi:5577_t:CDS:2 [Cetraspora pellucida]|uniref:5577_t:CDS:1 n=1 Tax=Cetraspora pellucida TaxID=1433469 RepID=A0ACA9LAJ6_9GLOM|nr:5577_t:CDS:2 [Cetraspora pellucida]